MYEEMDQDETYEEYTLRTGGKVNQYGGIYHPGQRYGLKKRTDVRDMYVRRSMGGHVQPNISEIASECAVSRYFVRLIENEVISSGMIQATPTPRSKRGGYGGYTFDVADYYVLIELYREEPSRTIGSYALNLQLRTGLVVSEPTIRRVLEKSFRYAGKLRAVNLIPLDKFRYENMIKAGEFVDVISKFPIDRIKCVDEKLLKNAEGLGRRARRDPITGIVPPTFTMGDFRNTYKLLGICGIDIRVSPVFFKIHKDKNDSEEYNDFILEVK